MYHDYFDDADTGGLRNPYAEVPLLSDERGPGRPRLLLLGVVGAGLSVVAGGHLASPGQVTASPDAAHRDPVPAADPW